MADLKRVFYHPEFTALQSDWDKYRLTYNGGTPFIDVYLENFSARESDDDFEARKKYTYSPSHSKKAINEIKNAISTRLVDITRNGGPASYHETTAGNNNGVDNNGRTMNDFISDTILPELLVMGKVGVFIDRYDNILNTKADGVKNQPYLYYYRAEDILSWTYDQWGNLVALLLRDNVEEKEDKFSLTISVQERLRYMRLTSDGVEVSFYQKDDMSGTTLGDTITLDLPRIPFTIFDIKKSLMTDIADYQIALLNIESSDIDFIIKANYPFYVEPVTPLEATKAAMRGADTLAVDMGSRKGRQYPQGQDQPAFIHPSPDPLMASMKKQEVIKDDINRLVQLAVTNLESSSADSKEHNDRSLESGLATLGSILAYGERQIASIWAMYEKSDDIATIHYPKSYTLKTDADRLKEADEYLVKISSVPSKTYQIEVAIEVARLMIGHRVSTETMDNIEKEIRASKVIVIDAKVLASDLEQGLVTKKTASIARQYPEDEAAKADIEHSDRLARIAAAQSSVPTDAVDNKPGARGVSDAASDKGEGAEEKADSRDNTEQDTITDRTRGEQKD